MSVRIIEFDPWAFDPVVVYRLEEDHVSGDILDFNGTKYIICDESNDVIYPGETELRSKFPAGMYIKLFRISGIRRLGSDSPIDIDGFKRYLSAEGWTYLAERYCKNGR
nr:MAG TPA: hypothetical protein [Caudoviricetes sp.]